MISSGLPLRLLSIVAETTLWERSAPQASQRRHLRREFMGVIQTGAVFRKKQR
jgi:hypothetical protein